MKYSDNFKNEVRQYSDTYGLQETYKKYENLYPDTIRKWCDREFYIKNLEMDRLRRPIIRANLTDEQRKQRLFNTEKWNRDHSLYSKLTRVQTKELYYIYSEFGIEDCHETFSQFSYEQIKKLIKRFEKSEQHRHENKEVIYARTKRWFSNNKDYVKQYTKEYTLTHIDKIREKYRLRKQNDPVFKLTENIRRRMWGGLTGYDKSAHTVELLGISFDEYKKYLEAKFLPGMSWRNYGPEWHIDHIIPISYYANNFDLSQKDIQIKAFHYTNTQPLWALDNLIKSNNYTP